MKNSKIFETVMNIFTKKYFKIFITELNARMKKKSVKNQILNKSLFIDFTKICENVKITKIDSDNSKYLYIELTINSIYEKNEQSNKIHCLFLLPKFQKSDYKNIARIANFLNHQNSVVKKIRTSAFDNMFVDSENKIHNISIKSTKIIAFDFMKIVDNKIESIINQSQFTTLKYFLNYLYLSYFTNVENLKSEKSDKKIIKKSATKK